MESVLMGFFPARRTMKKTTLILTLFVAALLAGLFLRWSAASVVPVKTAEKETFMQQERGMPLDMQSVEGPVGVQGFSGTPPLLGSEPKEVPLKPYEKANDSELFAFQNNKISAECCPSPFSTDTGCVCLTDAQIQDFSKRGGNRA
jgi:hypothetical protein